MRVAVTKGSLLVPPTYFALAHPRILAERMDFRFFVGAAHLADPAIRGEFDVDDTTARVLPLADSWPVRRREQLGALLTSSTARAIEGWNPDVLHQHFAYGSAAAVKAARRRRAPLLVTVHGGDAFVPLTPRSTRRPLGRPALARMQRDVAAAYRSAQRVLAVSEYIAGIAVRGGARADRVVVHYQGIDTDFFIPSADPAPDVPRVLFVGRLAETKGVLDLVGASTGLVSNLPHELVLVGDGPARAQIAEAEASHPHIRTTGSLTSDAVRDELRRAHVLVLPTKVNGIAREAAGLVLLEAQACGVPVIAYDSGGTSEMLRDGDTGWLAPEADVAALADRLRTSLIMSAQERRAMGERARAFVVADRSLARSAEQLAELYLEES